MTVQIRSTLQIVSDDNSGFSFPKIGGNPVNITQTIEGGGVPGYQKLTADIAETVDISELTALGVGFIKNIHDTTIVQIGKEVAAVFEPMLEVRPGEEYPLRFVDGITLQLKAIGADGEVQFYIFED